MSSGYSAPDTYLQTLQVVRAPNRPEEAVQFTNPIMEFENLGQEAVKNGIYYSWSTFAKDKKLSHLDSISKPVYPENPPSSENEKAVAWQRWHRNICFIIYEETRARRDGWEEVARKAASLLIPNVNPRPVR